METKTSFFVKAIPILGIAFFLVSCQPETSQPIVTDGDEEYHGFHPMAEAEMMMTYVDPATGEIPPGIRHKELSYVNTLPRKNKLDSRSGGAHTIKWYDAGPDDVGGRTRAIVFDRNDPQTMVAGGTTGGIWKSVDGGETWELKTAPGTHLNVTTIVQDPRPGESHNWYYATGELRGETGYDRGYTARNYGTGIYKSTDNGETWNVLSGSVPGIPTTWDGAFDFVHRMVINPLTGSLFIANNGSGIYRTTDDQVFPRVLGQTSEYLYNDIDVGSNGRLITVRSSLRVNWTHHSSGGVFVSDDDGVNWTEITPPTFPAQHHRSLVRIAPSNPNIAYILTNTGNTLPNGREDVRLHYLNLEEGTAEDRTEFLPNFPGTNIFLGPSVQTHGNYCMALNIRPDDENFVVLGGVSIFRSTNGFSEPIPTDKFATLIGGFEVIDGQNWPYMFENHWVDHHDMIFHPENETEMWSINDSGIYRTLDVDAPKVAWEDKSKGYNTTQYFTVAMGKEEGDGRMFGGAQDNGTRYFQEFGGAGQLEFTGGLEICAGDGSYGYIGEKYAYTSLQFGRVRRANYLNPDQTEIQTHLTFSLVNIGPPPNANTSNLFYIHPFKIDPNDEKIMYYPEANQMWRNENIESFNPLNTWTLLPEISAPSGSIISDLAVSTNPAHVLYYGATNTAQQPKIYRVENANTAVDGPVDISIPNAPFGAYVHDIAINPENADEVIVVLSNYNITGLYHTLDGGENWDAIEGNLTGNSLEPGPSIRSASIMPLSVMGMDETVYMVGTSSGLFSTCELNGFGTIWEQEAYEEMGNAIAEMIEYRPVDGRIAIATFGRSIFVGEIETESVGTENKTESEALFSVYPNPIASHATVNFFLDKAAAVSLNLNDAQGRTVQSIFKQKFFTEGDYSNSITLNEFPTGIYYLTLKIEGINPKQWTKKVILK